LDWAKLSQAYAAMFWFHGYNKENLDKAEEAATNALLLDEYLPEAHWAKGYCYYWGHYDYANALEEFEKAHKAQPDNSQFIAAIAYVHRQRGDFQQALYYLDKAFRLDKVSGLDSRSCILATEIALTCLNLREYEEALKYCDLAINLAPDQPKAYEWKACVYLREKGDTHEARKVLDIASLRIKSKDNAGSITYWLTVIDVYDEKYKNALDRLSPEPNDIKNKSLFDVLLYSQICRYDKDEKTAKECFTYAMNKLKPMVDEKPEAAYLHSQLGTAYAGLGKTEEAIEEGQRAVELRPENTDLRLRMFRTEDLARIYVMVGKYNEAIEQIQILLENHGRLSPAILKLDPDWKELHDYAEFQQLLE
jgi:tetratricopeptide (TPR) repeat protein